MKFRVLVAGVATVLTLSACAVALHPWYESGDVIEEPLLTGTWTGEDMSWTFAHRTDAPGYTLTITETDRGRTVAATMVATLFELDGHRYLDVMPSDIDDYAIPGIVSAGLFPGHLVLHVTGIDAMLEMALVDEDWLDEYLRDHPHALERYATGERWLLTSPTRKLQRFLIRHVDGPGLFGDTLALEKQ